MTKRKTPGKPSTPDWEAIERDYRTGKFTVRELEAKHGPSYSQISRRANKEGWTKDLRDVVREATAAAVIRETVAAAATTAQQDATTAVQAAAEVGKQVILGHRNELRNARNIAQTLLQELADATLADRERAMLATLLAGENGDPVDIAVAQSAIEKLLGLRSRVNSLKALAESLSKLQAAERIAFDLNEEGDKTPTDPLSTLLAKMQRSALPIVQNPPDEDGDA